MILEGTLASNKSAKKLARLLSMQFVFQHSRTDGKLVQEFRCLGPITALAIFASACGVLPGDASETVYLHNTLDVAVSVYQTDGKQAGPSQLVGPGQTATNRWLVAGKVDGKRRESGLPPRQVEAKTESGERVFCHRYTDTDLDGLRWTIDIKRNDDCK